MAGEEHKKRLLELEAKGTLSEAEKMELSGIKDYLATLEPKVETPKISTTEKAKKVSKKKKGGKK